MAMLTGMTAPSEGDVRVYGTSLLKNTRLARRKIGFCPQVRA